MLKRIVENDWMNIITKILAKIGCTSASTYEREYSLIQRKINRLCKTRNDRKRTCQTEDDAFFDGIQRNIDEHVDRLSETHNNLLAILNTFPIDTPCTIDVIADRVGLQTATAERILMAECVCKDGDRPIETQVYSTHQGTAVYLVQRNWRYVGEYQHYLERFDGE